ncbi:putative transcriptional regulator [Streptacidiphilus sp. MAP12-16]|uniref:BlaI/MecI/CopY family transcriptional regulator n=1 Tax=Streptacidiphilus sp. MAP12-16 TaxID=3156300 RepID=UPI003518E096
MVRQLGELENEVMTRVWQWNRPVTVREVLEDLLRERELAYTTVMTVMDKLFQKGWLRREQEGRAFRYEPVSSREAYTAALMNDAWATSDNPAAALVHFFGMMSPEQQEALRDALRVAAPPSAEHSTEQTAEEAAEETAEQPSADIHEPPDATTR